LGDFLLLRGYARDESPGMAVDLLNMNDRLPAIPGLVIEQVRDNTVFNAWNRTFGKGFGQSEALNKAFAYLFESLGFTPAAPITHYLARLDGEAVATSSLVIGIYNVTTLPEARCKGIGAAITLAPLLDARARGYRAGVLFASEMGFSVYQRLGFKEYCKIVTYEKESA
jgi:GNAT superfamily N-acetyltransferase